MSAELKAAEPAARYLKAQLPTLVERFDLLATAPGGVARLRELILTLAVRGKLVAQDAGDEPASVLLASAKAAKHGPDGRVTVKQGNKSVDAAPDEELPFEVPQGWAWTRFGDVSLVSGGVTLGRKGALARPVVLPYVRVANVQRWRIDLAVMKEVVIDESEVERYRLVDGDLLIIEGGDSDKVGRTAIWQGEVPTCLHQNHVFRARSAYGAWTPAWGQLYLNSPTARSYFAASAKQTTNLASINMSELRACPFPLPPLQEQARIVARVDELMRLCDALEAKGRLEAEQHAHLLNTLLGTLTDSSTPEELAANWQRVADHFDLLLDRPEAVDALEQTILQLAVRGLLVHQDPQDVPATSPIETGYTETGLASAKHTVKGRLRHPSAAGPKEPHSLPVGWTWTLAANVMEMLNGYAFKSEWFKSRGTRLLRNVNVSHGATDWSQVAYIDDSLAASYAQFKLVAGDIVLSLDRPIISTGLKLAVLTDADLPCLLLQRVARLSPNRRALSSDYLLLWLQSDLFVGAIDPGRSNGVPHISTKQVSGLTLGLPPLQEQARIVARVTELRRLCADLRQRLAASRSTQAHLADALVEQAAA